MTEALAVFMPTIEGLTGCASKKLSQPLDMVSTVCLGEAHESRGNISMVIKRIWVPGYAPHRRKRAHARPSREQENGHATTSREQTQGGARQASQAARDAYIQRSHSYTDLSQAVTDVRITRL